LHPLPFLLPSYAPVGPRYAVSLSLFSSSARAPRPVPSFPTRRSSDLPGDCQACLQACDKQPAAYRAACLQLADEDRQRGTRLAADRKSTRLNSSHGSISYAVFCLKKKTEAWHCGAWDG